MAEKADKKSYAFVPLASVTKFSLYNHSEQLSKLSLYYYTVHYTSLNFVIMFLNLRRRRLLR
jgi:hypothetical protein